MGQWAKKIVSRFLNVGTPMAVMGALWLYLWVFPWRQAYVAEPHWGHNYAEAAAFLAVGLAYFNRRFLSDVLALLASLLVIPAAMELVPHLVTAVAGGVLVLLVLGDMLVERGRKEDLAQPSNRRLRLWLKSHLLRFAYLMLAHIALTYYVVRLPVGTYETDLVTQVYNALALPFLVLALVEGAIKGQAGVLVSRAGFFWGMLTMMGSLIVLVTQPETWICLAIVVLLTLLGVASLWVAGKPLAKASS